VAILLLAIVLLLTPAVWWMVTRSLDEVGNKRSLLKNRGSIELNDVSSRCSHWHQRTLARWTYRARSTFV